jgi:hypothetical protein
MSSARLVIHARSSSGSSRRGCGQPYYVLVNAPPCRGLMRIKGGHACDVLGPCLPITSRASPHGRQALRIPSTQLLLLQGQGLRVDTLHQPVRQSARRTFDTSQWSASLALSVASRTNEPGKAREDRLWIRRVCSGHRQGSGTAPASERQRGPRLTDCRARRAEFRNTGAPSDPGRSVGNSACALITQHT